MEKKEFLRYRGYSIEELAEKATFLEVAYFIYGELPTKSELDFFIDEITHHSLVHEDVKSILDGFPSKVSSNGCLIVISFFFNSILS